MKNYKRVTYSIDKETDKRLRIFAKKTGLKMSTIVAQAIEKYVK